MYTEKLGQEIKVGEFVYLSILKNLNNGYGAKVSDVLEKIKEVVEKIISKNLNNSFSFRPPNGNSNTLQEWFELTPGVELLETATDPSEYVYRLSNHQKIIIEKEKEYMYQLFKEMFGFNPDSIIEA